MPIHAKAPMFLDEGRIAFQKREYGDLKPGKLLLRVEANAICGTDRIQYFGGSTCVPGHDGVGTVIAAGDETTTAIGTRGAILLMDFCGQCRSCCHGHTNQCSAKRKDMGFAADGGFLDSKIIAHQVPRAEIDRAFELFLAGETGKVVVVGNDQ